jgi:hypothetical protein
MNVDAVKLFVEAHPVPIGLTVGGIALGYLIAHRSAKSSATGTVDTSTTGTQAPNASVAQGATGPVGPPGPAGKIGPMGPAGQVPPPLPKPKPQPTPTPTVPGSKTITDQQRKQFSCPSGALLTWGRGTDASNLVCRNTSTNKDFPVTTAKK